MFPLIEIIHKFPDINYHLYADNLQIYIQLPLYNLPCDKYSQLNCLNTLINWCL